MAMRTVIGHDGRKYKVPDNRKGKARKSSGKASGKPAKGKARGKSSGKASGRPKGALAARVSKLEAASRDQSQAISGIIRTVAKHDAALNAVAKLAENRWNANVPGFPARASGRAARGKGKRR